MRQNLTVDSPLGGITLIADGGALVELRFARVADNWQPPAGAGRGASGAPAAQAMPAESPEAALLSAAARQLKEYFAGARRDFDVAVAPRGTDFQRAVWLALRDIPYGETLSYGELAARLGRPRAVRAVGLANGRNPLAIILPCHRVIGADGGLTGYGGGLPAKRFLLELEGALPALSPWNRRRAPC